MTDTQIPFEERRKNAIEGAEQRCREVWSKCPEIEDIDKRLSNTGLAIFKSAMLPDLERERELERLRAENEALRERRAKLLEKMNLPSDYTSPKFVCEKCSDTGFIGHRMCTCLKSFRTSERLRA